MILLLTWLTVDTAVGFRVEHPQELINRIQYGAFGDLCERGKGKVPVRRTHLFWMIRSESVHFFLPSSCVGGGLSAGIAGGS